MDSSSFNPDEFLASTAPQQPVGASGGFDPDQFLKENETPPPNDLANDDVEQAKAMSEGLAQGVLGFAAPLIETHMFGVKPEDIARRQTDFPGSHGIAEAAGVGLGLYSGIGEAGLIAKGVGRFIPEGASVFAKLGSAALKGALETGLIQGGDEITKGILGQADPETPVASALAHMGAAAVLGGGLGGSFGTASAGLAKLGETQVGTRAAKFVEDFGKRKWFNDNNPDLYQAAKDEFQTFHDQLSAARESVWGRHGLKNAAVDELTKEITPEQLSRHLSEINDAINSAPAAIRDSPEFQEAANAWRSKVTPQSGTLGAGPFFTPEAKDVFNATDTFKRQLGELGYPRGQVNFESRPFVNAAKSVGSRLQTSLEDPSIWGDAGNLQRELNKATSEFIPDFKQLNNTFAEKQKDIPVVSPGKLLTYINQLGNPRAEIKQSVMKHAVESGEKYLGAINDAYGKVGIKSPFAQVSTDVLKRTFGETTAGGQFADQLHNFTIPQFTKHIAGEAGGIGGASIGYREGGIKGAIAGGLMGIFAPHAAQIVGRGITRKAIPAVYRALTSDTANGMMQFLDYANQANRGAQRINLGLDSLFKAGGQQAIDAYASDTDRENLKKYVESGQQSHDIQEKLKELNKQTPGQPPQGFAEGGDVKQPAEAMDTGLHGINGIANHAPTQNLLLETAKARINTYLNSVRPSPIQSSLPFDNNPPDKQKMRDYDKVLDLANQPLSILNHIKNGSLTPETLNHFSSMYPELHNHLNKKITEKVMQAQMDENKPPYKVRQAMSLFVGAPLDSGMTPMSIQAAQSVFQNQKSQQQPAPAPGKNKKGTGNLDKISKGYMTGPQAREARQDKS